MFLQPDLIFAGSIFVGLRLVRRTQLFAHFAKQFLRQAIGRKEDLTDFALRTFAQRVLVFLELLQLARRFPQFQNFLFKLGDVSISRFQF